MRISLTTVAFLGLISSPALALDPCLVGNWQADLDDLAQMLGAQMGAQVAVSSGTVAMQIGADDNLTMTITDLTYNVSMPDIPPMDVSLSGVSSATMAAESGAWTAATTDFDLLASADVMGQVMEIPFDSDSGLFGGGDGTYACAGDSASFETAGETPRMPRKWTRVD